MNSEPIPPQDLHDLGSGLIRDTLRDLSIAVRGLTVDVSDLKHQQAATLSDTTEIKAEVKKTNGRVNGLEDRMDDHDEDHKLAAARAKGRAEVGAEYKARAQWLIEHWQGLFGMLAAILLLFDITLRWTPL